MRKNGGAGRAGRVSQKRSFLRDTYTTIIDELEGLRTISKARVFVSLLLTGLLHWRGCEK
jgi:hypothetical protein